MNQDSGAEGTVLDQGKFTMQTRPEAVMLVPIASEEQRRLLVVAIFGKHCLCSLDSLPSWLWLMQRVQDPSHRAA